MGNKIRTYDVFDIKKCRAKTNGVVDLIECLALEQASSGGCSFPFGSSYFCKHSHRNKFIENTEKLPGKLGF